MTTKALVDLGLLLVLWMIGTGAVCYRAGRKNGYQAGRVDEHGDSAAKILNAKKEGMLAERQRLSPSSTSKQ